MKTHIYISALLVVASALLSSCSLLVSSPIHPSGPHPHFGRSNKVYSETFEVPAEGGIYEFDCADDQFYILRIYDSSMLVSSERSNCRHSPTLNNFMPVFDLTYSGSFYTITCNRDEHNWIINVDPLIATSAESDYREIRVLMWDGSDDSDFVFQFEQGDFESYGYIK